MNDPVIDQAFESVDIHKWLTGATENKLYARLYISRVLDNKYEIVNIFESESINKAVAGGEIGSLITNSS